MTSENLGYKPDAVQTEKLEYSPLGQVFNKGLEKDENQKDLLKRLKIIEDKTDEHLLALKDSKDNKDDQLSIKPIDYDIRKNLSPEGLHALKKIVDKEKEIDYKYLYMKPSSKNRFDFRIFMSLKPFFQTIYFEEVLIPAIEREREQVVFDGIIEKLKKYKPRTEDNVNDKDNVLKNAQNLYKEREMIINTFKNKLFPLYSGNYYEEFKEESSESEGEDEKPEDKIPDISTSEQITKIGKFYGSDLINKYFNKKSLKEIIKT